LPTASIDLICTDPPYNLGKDFGCTVDRREWSEYERFTSAWLTECWRVLKPTGSIYVCMGVRFISRLYLMLEEMGFLFNGWITWHYTQGVGRKIGFSPRHEDILYFTKSKEYKFKLDDAAGKVILAIVLEVQREKKARKKYTWAVYWAVARAERECPAVVLVVAPDDEVAAWAGEKIDMGLGLGTIQPLVLGPATLPVLTDPTVAMKEVELAVLSAMAHGNGPHGLAVVQAAFLALGRLDREHAAVYFQILWDVLREPVQRALEALAMEQQTEGKARFPPFAEALIERGIREGELKGELKGKLDGIREGELKGKRDGIREGELKGKRDALLRLLTRAGLAPTEDPRARILACADLVLLNRWMDNVLGAKTAADVLS
jgi:hypothetical protein